MYEGCITVYAESNALGQQLSMAYTGRLLNMDVTMKLTALLYDLQGNHIAHHNVNALHLRTATTKYRSLEQVPHIS